MALMSRIRQDMGGAMRSRDEAAESAGQEYKLRLIGRRTRTGNGKALSERVRGKLS